jgi:hypothetical protein
MTDAPHEQYRPQEAPQAPLQPSWQPSATDYHSFGTNALDQRTQATNNLIGMGVLTDLQLNFSAQEAPVMLDYNQTGSAEQSGTVIDYPSSKISAKALKGGMDWEQQPDSRQPSEKLQDFLGALTQNATNPENYKQYIQGELDKLTGIGEGLNSAKEATKGAAAAGLKALTDGTVADFLSKPNAINDPLFKTVSNALESMGKDRNATNKALEALGTALEQSSEHYSAFPNHQKGIVIGEAMFGLTNLEGSTEAADAALKIADTVATHVDKAVMKTIAQSIKAIDDIARTAPEAAQQSKQMLFDYLKGKGLTGPELEYAGIPKGYFDGLPNIEQAKPDDSILKMVGRCGEYTPKLEPKFLDVNQGKVLNEIEIEKLGGAAKLEKMTDQDLQKVGLERFRLPKLKLDADEYSLSASTPGINNAMVNATVPEKGTVILSYIKKGYLPDGAGSYFLAEALKAHDVLPLNQLILKNIINKETLTSFENGVPAAETKLGKFAIKAFKELGLTPKDIRYDWNPQIKRLNIVIEAGK